MNYKTDKNVYILGAGFSLLAGIPTIERFLDKTKEVSNLLNDKRQLESISKLLEFRLAASSAGYRTKIDLDNIEELFSFISALDAGYDLVDSVVDSIVCTISKTKIDLKSIKRSLPKEFETNKFDFENYRVGDWKFSQLIFPYYEYILLRLLGKFTSNSSPENSFISFNYDLILEESLSSLNIPFDYYLDKKKEFNSVLPILKLHGSINWGFPQTRGKNLKVYSDESECLENSKTFAIIPPTWNKSIFNEAKNVWQQSINELETATRIVIIGFSFPETDNHFKYLLSVGLRNNISLQKIIFINPMNTEIAKSKLGNVFNNAMFEKEKIEIISEKLEDIIDSKYLLNLINR